MKRLLFLLLILFCFTGCQVMAAKLESTIPASPPVVVMASPEDSASEQTTTEPTTKQPATTEPATTEPTTTEPATTQPATTEPPTQPATEPPATTQPAQQPPSYQYGDTTPTWDPARAASYPADSACGAALLLEKWMAVEGLILADLNERGCRQLILVVAQPPEGVETVTVCYEREPGGGFVPVEGLEGLRGFVGKNGIRHDRRRNTNTSPAGLWALSFAFGNEPPPEGLKLPWRQVTPNSDWVCDEDSPYFNTWQERGDPALLPWSDDVERLADYPAQYAWACVIEFNRPPDVVPARGCAIFLHCSTGGTGGCVGLAREELPAVLGWLDPAKKPCILITGTERP